MGYLELDLELSPDVKAMLEQVGSFSRKARRPIGIELDKLADPNDVIAKNSKLWDVFKAYRQLGLHTLKIPKELGGLKGELDPKIGAILGEELGFGDAGLAASVGVSNMPFVMASMSPEPALQQLARDYCEDMNADMIGCWAITEPGHGSDWVMSVDEQFDDPSCAPEVTAELKGDEYILKGQKAAWVSNGTIGTHAVLHVGLEPSKGMQGNGLAVIPLDLPGITRGKPLDKIGQRPLNQGELFFEEVKIPKKYMLVPSPETMRMVTEMILILANGGMGALFVGVARAAYEEALNYARERVQGGVPIFEHQNIKLQLFRMFEKVETARAYARRISLYNEKAESGSAHHTIAFKVLSTRTAFEVASEAITIFGGNGLTKEYPIEKIFRDARASMIEDGENNVLSILAAKYLTC